MAEEVSNQEMVLTLRKAGYTDATVALEMARHLPGAVPPSLNSVRRWRYGETEPSPHYAAVLRLVYASAKTSGLLKEVE
jgi:hypothetical protein